MSPKPQKPEFSAAVLETLPPEDRTELYEAVIRTGADTRLLQDLDLAGLTAALAGDGLEAPPGSPPALMRALLLHHRARQFGIGWYVNPLRQQEAQLKLRIAVALYGG